MQTLNLAHLEKSDIKYTITTFPDEEPHIIIDSNFGKDKIVVRTRICNPKDLLILMEVNDILTRAEVEWELEISYLMSMRMDRVMGINRPYTLKIVAGIMNGFSCHTISVFSPHSFKTQSLIKKCDILSMYDGTNINSIVRKLDISDFTLVFPDEGAANRYFDFDEDYVIIFNKVRNINIGEILSFEIEKEPNIVSENIIFIDDLCDGGGTFLGELNILKEKYPDKKYSIYVTHCVNKIGLQRLLNAFDKVYTTNSYKDWKYEFYNEWNNGRLIIEEVI